jgi:hypothetical protein
MRFFILRAAVIVLFFSICSLLYAGENEKTLCSRCGNEIKSDNIKYSVVQLDAKKPVSFDDIGHAVLWREDQCTAIQMSFDATAKVFDFNTGEELDINAAYFIKSPDIQSPGGSGIAAFKERQSADKLLPGKGSDKVLTYDDLLMLNLK